MCSQRESRISDEGPPNKKEVIKCNQIYGRRGCKTKGLWHSVNDAHATHARMHTNMGSCHMCLLMCTHRHTDTHACKCMHIEYIVREGHKENWIRTFLLFANGIKSIPQCIAEVHTIQRLSFQWNKVAKMFIVVHMCFNADMCSCTTRLLCTISLYTVQLHFCIMVIFSIQNFTYLPKTIQPFLIYWLIQFYKMHLERLTTKSSMKQLNLNNIRFQIVT